MLRYFLFQPFPNGILADLFCNVHHFTFLIVMVRTPLTIHATFLLTDKHSRLTVAQPECRRRHPDPRSRVGSGFGASSNSGGATGILCRPS